MLHVPLARADAPLNIAYTLSAKQKVSINIYDSSGQIVRELLHGAERTTGSKTEPWDGRDDAGNAVPAGSYSWKMLSTPGFGVEYVTSPGANYKVDQTGPYNNQSVGCHGGPQTVAVDASGFYVSGQTENIENGMMKHTLTGSSRVWSQQHFIAWGWAVSMTPVGTTLWSLYDSGTLFKQDSATGNVQSSIPVAYNGENPTDMTANTSGVVLCYPVAGIVRWLDNTGTETRSVSVPGAGTVDVAPDGTVYVISGTELRKITPIGTTSTVLVSGLVSPRRAAVNSSNGDIYVLQTGTSQQVRRYSSTGALLNTYGVAGGRVDGLYQTQKTSFRGGTDIAVESNGNFWVAERDAAPRRVARFNAAGTWLSEYYGGQVWAPYIMPELDNPRYVWIASQWGSLMRCDVDYAAKTWAVHSTYVADGLADGLIAKHGNGEVWTSRMHGGEVFLCREGYPTVLKVDRTNSKLIPVSVAIGNFGQDPDTYPQWARDQAAAVGAKSMLWTDANGDGRPLNADATMQTNELQFFTAQATQTNSICLDNDFNYVSYNGNSGKIIRWTVSGWNALGAPIYGDFPAGVNIADKPSRQTGLEDGRWTSYVTSDADGNIWGAFNPNITNWGTSSDAFIARWNPSGTLAWQSGRMNNKAGSLGTMRHIYGVINNGTNSNNLVVGRFSYEWETEGVTPVYVYNQDGLYAGLLLNKPVNQGTTANWRYGLGGEGLAGQIMKHTDGNVYFFGHWINEGRIYKITGWDNWQRANGTVTVPGGYAAPSSILEPIGPSSTGTGILGQYYSNETWSGTPTLTRVDPTLDYVWNQTFFTANSPLPGSAAYSIRWNGNIVPRRTGWHMFRQNRGNGGGDTFRVNGITVAWSRNPGRAIWLQSGVAYPFTLDYSTLGSHPSTIHGVELQWSEPETNGTWALVPQSQLNPPAK